MFLAAVLRAFLLPAAACAAIGGPTSLSAPGRRGWPGCAVQPCGPEHADPLAAQCRIIGFLICGDVVFLQIEIKPWPLDEAQGQGIGQFRQRAGWEHVHKPCPRGI